MLNLIKKIWNLPQPIWIVIGLAGGVIAGATIGKPMLDLAIVGKLWVNAILLIVGPLVFCSVATGVMSLSHSNRSVGKLAGKAGIIYIASMAIGVAIAISIALVFNVGAGLPITELLKHSTHPQVIQHITSDNQVIHLLKSIIPRSAVQAFAKNNLLGIIFFAVLFGFCANLIGRKAKATRLVIQSFGTVFIQIMQIVMKFAPIGVFVILGGTIAETGIDTVQQFASVLLIIFSSFLVIFIVATMLVSIICRVNPLQFLRNLYPVILTAVSTSSSLATLPVNLRTAERRMGVDHKVSGFFMSVAATISLTGLCSWLSICAIAALHATGHSITVLDLTKILTICILGAISASGTPGAGIFTLALVWQSLSLPPELLGIFIGLDRCGIDQLSTVTNTSIDASGAVILGHSEGL